MFNDNLFNFGLSAMLCTSVFSIYSVSGLLVPFEKDPSVLTREVSSAYVMNLKTVLACEKSLIYIINNIGPSIEPCGTPVFKGKTFDFMSSVFFQIAHGLLINSLIIVMLRIPSHNVLIYLRGLCGQAYRMFSINQEIHQWVIRCYPIV